MEGKPTMLNFKLLADIYPWRDKGWRVSTGFYLGTRKVATAINTMYEMPSLLAVNIYNSAYDLIYDYIMETDFMETPIYKDFYLDPFLVDEIRERLKNHGPHDKIGVPIGQDSEGNTTYMMLPDKDGTVSANAFANAFKPYLGVGYTGPVSKNKRWTLDFDLGVLFWGGYPKVVTHEGVDLTQQERVRGKVGTYVDIMKHFVVWPQLSITISYNLF